MICNCTGNCMRVCSVCYRRLGCSGTCDCLSRRFYLKIIEPVPITIQFPGTVIYDDDIRWYYAQEEIDCNNEYTIEWDDSKAEKCPAD